MITITLILDANPMAIRQYVATDAQGVANVISVSDVRTNVVVDEGLFAIPAN